MPTSRRVCRVIHQQERSSNGKSNSTDISFHDAMMQHPMFYDVFYCTVLASGNRDTLGMFTSKSALCCFFMSVDEMKRLKTW